MALAAMIQTLLPEEEKKPLPGETQEQASGRFLRKITQILPLKPLERQDPLGIAFSNEFNKLTHKNQELIQTTTRAITAEKPPERKPPVEPTVKPGLLIERIPYPRWWRDSLNARIYLVAPASAVLATVSGELRLWVATIVLTVTGKTRVSFTFGNAGSSGPIFLGGVDEPKGIVIAMGQSPAPCGSGNLVISATDPDETGPLVGGWATCFAEEYKK